MHIRVLEDVNVVIKYNFSWTVSFRLSIASEIIFYSKLMTLLIRIKSHTVYVSWYGLSLISTHGYIHGYPYPWQPWIIMIISISLEESEDRSELWRRLANCAS